MPPSALAHLAHLPDGALQRGLRARIETLGWRPGGGVSAYTFTAGLETLSAASVPLPDGLVVDRAEEPDAAWLATCNHRGAPLPTAAVAMLVSAPQQAFFTVREAGARGLVTAVARGSIADGWLGVTAVEVTPPHRRRGVARALMRVIAEWAAGQSARRAFLQTAVANTAAHRLYLGAGFTVHHRYDYLTPPG
jgi:GNAT superfamily N-acetyltransferase